MGDTRKACGLLLLALLALPLVACDSGGQSTESGRLGVIEGEVFYRERMMLPPGAELEVQLQDISRADAMATVIASVHITTEGGPPYPFAIEYDAGRIDPRMTYGLRATISAGGRLLFTTTDYNNPFADGPLDILVRRVAESGNPDR